MHWPRALKSRISQHEERQILMSGNLLGSKDKSTQTHEKYSPSVWFQKHYNRHHENAVILFDFKKHYNRHQEKYSSLWF